MKRNSKIRTFAGFMAVALMLSTFANDYNTIAAHANQENPAGEVADLEEEKKVEAPPEEEKLEEAPKEEEKLEEAPKEEEEVEEAPKEEEEVEEAPKEEEEVEEAPEEETPVEDEGAKAAETQKSEGQGSSNSVTITYVSSDESQGSVTNSTDTVDKSVESPTINGSTATPNPGYSFLEWKEGDSTASQEATFTPGVPAADVTYTAYFTATSDGSSDGEQTNPVNITFNLVDENGSSIGDSKSLSDFSFTDNTIVLDKDLVPTITNYDFQYAEVGGTKITSLSRTESTGEGDTTTYTYSTSKGKINSDTTIDLVYGPNTNNDGTQAQSFKVVCVDENNKEIKNYESVDLPAFNSDGKIVLSDKDKAPIEIPDYSYRDATIGTTVITSIVKETKTVDGAEQTTYSYYYTEDGSEKSRELTSEDKICFEYKLTNTASVEGLTVSCVDTDGKAITDHEKVALSELKFNSDNELVLNDKDNAPYTISKYSYKEARIDGTDGELITSLSKTVSEDGSKTVYSYKTEKNDTAEEITKDTKIVFVYTTATPAIHATFNDDTNYMTVTVDAPEGAFPEGTVVHIVPIVPEAESFTSGSEEDVSKDIIDETVSKDTAEKANDVINNALADKLDASADEIKQVSYDITFYCKNKETGEDEEIQPDESSVTVKFIPDTENDNSPLNGLNVDDLQVFHMTENNDDAKGLDIDSIIQDGSGDTVAKEVSTSTDTTDSANDTLKATTNSFSIYTITGTVHASTPEDIYYVAAGGSVILAHNDKDDKDDGTGKISTYTSGTWTAYRGDQL